MAPATTYGHLEDTHDFSHDDKLALQREKQFPMYGRSRDANCDATLFSHPPLLPKDQATPDAVRRYLSQVLVARGFHLIEAQRIATLWQHGSGRELRSYPPTIFYNIFGIEIGWIIYLEIRQLILTEDAKSRTTLARCFAITGVAFLVVGLVAGMIWYFADLVDILIFGMCVAPIGVAILLFSRLVATLGLQHPLDQAEDELREAIRGNTSRGLFLSDLSSISKSQ